VTGTPFSQAQFQAHVELLQLFLTEREDTVERIEGILNAQRKPVHYLEDRPLLSRLFEDCFFRSNEGASSLRGQLEAAHWASGFKPREVHHVFNDLIHPAEMMIRAFHCWHQTRWPGGNGRTHYAHTLFNLYVIRRLQFLSMRIWDEDPAGAAARLAQIQGVLDQLWKSSPANQPAILRDARWLIPLAQSTITDELAPYLEVARQVTETLPKEDALEIWKAQVRMLGGHLTSQIRYYSTKDGVSIDDPSVVVRTRSSNALDFALLIWGLVELLKAYDCAFESGDERQRLDLAGAIYQGISPDPELFLNRVDLLGAYTMMEHVFIATDRYSPLGQRHIHLLKEYAALIDRWIEPLCEESPHFRPVAGACSPYGVLFGTPANLIEHMALKAIEHDAETRFGIEDVFVDQDTGGAKLAWVNGWRKLPHIPPDVQRQYDYPQQFAEEIHARVEHQLSRSGVPGTGRLYIESGDNAIPELPARYKVQPHDRAQLLRDRQEAHFLVSYETPGGWIALKKDLLTEVLGAGRDARISGLPAEAAQVLRLMCPDLNA
jgi:hypothetical protein